MDREGGGACEGRHAQTLEPAVLDPQPRLCPPHPQRTLDAYAARFLGPPVVAPGADLFRDGTGVRYPVLGGADIEGVRKARAFPWFVWRVAAGRPLALRAHHSRTLLTPPCLRPSMTSPSWNRPSCLACMPLPSWHTGAPRRGPRWRCWRACARERAVQPRVPPPGTGQPTGPQQTC